ncbi:N utilization substance protein A [Deferribacter desulfuricans SSM1]|uniref:Transcription termination/antitermination protein NusA n=1 Tax=Deferribacter desulfuricans (strain DSM 14783 / JCM 11476 / NBRC 101012 / SSM1) TaxID=639282 RepID=D3PEG4_DEFDS|nr:transcription termination factor NusA [Deferribacter desulfuricans]BAI80987.1 N utilization substance protein A [Deferribacter desulfuricans SSM1]
MKELAKVADEIGKEKGLSKELLKEALEDSIKAAVIRKYGRLTDPEVTVDIERGKIDIKVPKEVVESVENKKYEILLEDAKKIKPDAELGDVIMVPISFQELGRQAATVAKQRMVEKIREAEKQVVYDEFQNKIGQIVTGVVLKSDKDSMIVSIGKTEAFMPKREIIPGDYYDRGDYVRALLLEIRVIRGWPQLILSRTHPDFLKKLFEVEIPEVFEGIIEVKAVAREPGDRAKVAVYSKNSNIDPVGACIGLKGTRINAISNELRGEKIDVIEWSPDPVKFVCNALSPADVILTNIFEDEKTIEVVVPDDQLSLAIGKRGQNVRLAAMLTGWRLDVLKESEYNIIRKERLQEQEEELKEFYEIYNLENIDVLDENMISKLIEHGIDDVEKLSTASVDEVVMALGVNEDQAVVIINSAIDYLTEKLEELDYEVEDEEELSENED